MSVGSTQNLLRDKTVIITGASSGIGAAAARLFATEGASVALMARRKDKLEALAQEIEAGGGRVLVTAGNVTAAVDVEQAVARTLDAFGRLDAAFNNAGWGSIGTQLHETDDATFDHIMDTNVRGVWNCLKYQIPAMLQQEHGGAIVNTSSTAGLFATGAMAPYVAAKHAVLGLTRAAAAEYGERRIRVNALMVGSTRTELMEEAMQQVPQLEEAAVSRAIQQRLADPVEVAQAAAFLLSARASFITGSAMAVDGGCSAI